MCGRTAATGFDAWAPTYEQSALQSTLYLPAQERALQFAQQLMPRPKRVLDIGCGTGRLLRQARQQYPSAMLVGVDLAWGMVATAAAATTGVLAPGGVLVVADVFSTCRRRSLRAVVPWRRGHDHGGAPVELAAVLATHGLVMVGCERVPWFRLPDVQVIAAQKPLCPYLDLPDP